MAKTLTFPDRGAVEVEGREEGEIIISSRRKTGSDNSSFRFPSLPLPPPNWKKVCVPAMVGFTLQFFWIIRFFVVCLDSIDGTTYFLY